MIEVEDDGTGFREEATASGDDRSHIGINNLRERLRMMCDGVLEIESEAGKGTLARILIPVA
ncbi:MAG: hypothetical protein IKQ49_10020 [Eubacterium sp.]|nr:hypothetical protein [Eubacterium sp.]